MKVTAELAKMKDAVTRLTRLGASGDLLVTLDARKDVLFLRGDGKVFKVQLVVPAEVSSPGYTVVRLQDILGFLKGRAKQISLALQKDMLALKVGQLAGKIKTLPEEHLVQPIKMQEASFRLPIGTVKNINKFLDLGTKRIISTANPSVRIKAKKDKLYLMTSDDFGGALLEEDNSSESVFDVTSPKVLFEMAEALSGAENEIAFVVKTKTIGCFVGKNCYISNVAEGDIVADVIGAISSIRKTKPKLKVVVDASSLKEALSQVTGVAPDVQILDIVFKGTTGLAKIIKSEVEAVAKFNIDTKAKGAFSVSSLLFQQVVRPQTGKMQLSVVDKVLYLRVGDNLHYLLPTAT